MFCMYGFMFCMHGCIFCMEWFYVLYASVSFFKLCIFISAVMNLRVPLNAGNFLTSCKPVSFSRGTLHHGVSK